MIMLLFANEFFWFFFWEPPLLLRSFRIMNFDVNFREKQQQHCCGNTFCAASFNFHSKYTKEVMLNILLGQPIILVLFYILLNAGHRRGSYTWTFSCLGHPLFIFQCTRNRKSKKNRAPINQRILVSQFMTNNGIGYTYSRKLVLSEKEKIWRIFSWYETPSMSTTRIMLFGENDGPRKWWKGRSQRLKHASVLSLWKSFERKMRKIII